MACLSTLQLAHNFYPFLAMNPTDELKQAIQQSREREKNTTPPPWIHEYVAGEYSAVVRRESPHHIGIVPDSPSDHEFIASSRTELPMWREACARLLGMMEKISTDTSTGKRDKMYQAKEAISATHALVVAGALGSPKDILGPAGEK